MMDVAPGSDKAMLTLADGTKVALDETADGLVREFKGVKIIKQGDKVIYEFANNPDANAPIAYNTISTPRGGEYQLVLPDGTRVWLNAASSLRFPTAFASSERAVELEGEGYFEVAKRKNQPFKVVANNTTVEVLGTHFNLKAYKNEGSSQTSLLEGSVKVGNGTTKTIIKPGEQAVVGASATIETLQADMEQVVAWKEGYFQFNEEDFTSVVAQLERWYDVDFNYPASLANKKFAGAIPRNSNLSQVLEMLELSGSITFKMEERRIMAIPQE
jgi:ferric-dicitrate binding protein FerR (iron transport regulator)